MKVDTCGQRLRRGRAEKSSFQPVSRLGPKTAPHPTMRCCWRLTVRLVTRRGLSNSEHGRLAEGGGSETHHEELDTGDGVVAHVERDARGHPHVGGAVVPAAFDPFLCGHALSGGQEGCESKHVLCQAGPDGRLKRRTVVEKASPGRARVQVRPAAHRLRDATLVSRQQQNVVGLWRSQTRPRPSVLTSARDASGQVGLDRQEVESVPPAHVSAAHVYVNCRTPPEPPASACLCCTG